VVAIKKRGRPRTTGPGVQIAMRWHQPLLKRIEDWAKQQGVATRGEAIRHLVEKGLGTPPSHVAEPKDPMPSSMTPERAAFLKGAEKI
jgi:hypothetical protein